MGRGSHAHEPLSHAPLKFGIVTSSSVKRNLTPGSTPSRSSTAFQHRSHAPSPSNHAYYVISCVSVRKPPETVRHGPNSTHLLVRRTRPPLTQDQVKEKNDTFLNPGGITVSQSRPNQHKHTDLTSKSWTSFEIYHLYEEKRTIFSDLRERDSERLKTKT